MLDALTTIIFSKQQNNNNRITKLLGLMQIESMNCPREGQDMDFIIDRTSTALLMLSFCLFTRQRDGDHPGNTKARLFVCLFICLFIYCMCRCLGLIDGMQMKKSQVAPETLSTCHKG